MLPEAAQTLQGILPVARREFGENALQQYCQRRRTRVPLGFAQGRLFDSVNTCFAKYSRRSG